MSSGTVIIPCSFGKWYQNAVHIHGNFFLNLIFRIVSRSSLISTALLLIFLSRRFATIIDRNWTFLVYLSRRFAIIWSSPASTEFLQTIFRIVLRSLVRLSHHVRCSLCLNFLPRNLASGARAYSVPLAVSVICWWRWVLLLSTRRGCRIYLRR
jgi:hypothetical protein